MAAFTYIFTLVVTLVIGGAVAGLITGVVLVFLLAQPAEAEQGALEH